MKAFVSMDAREIDKLANVISQYKETAEDAINRILHGYAYDEIEKDIKRIMPESGRKWRGKRAAAKTAKSLEPEKGNLYIKVKSKKNYSYLYFPDDGSNTKAHRGEQHFMLRGAETASENIINRCIAEIVKG